MANVNGRAIVTGALKYSTDVKVPGMLAGRWCGPEGLPGHVAGFDAREAEKLPG
jgi:hypothetical protein